MPCDSGLGAKMLCFEERNHLALRLSKTKDVDITLQGNRCHVPAIKSGFMAICHLNIYSNIVDFNICYICFQNNTLISGGGDNEVYLWDLESGECKVSYRTGKFSWLSR